MLLCAYSAWLWKWGTTVAVYGPLNFCSQPQISAGKSQNSTNSCSFPALLLHINPLLPPAKTPWSVTTFSLAHLHVSSHEFIIHRFLTLFFLPQSVTGQAAGAGSGVAHVPQQIHPCWQVPRTWSCRNVLVSRSREVILGCTWARVSEAERQFTKYQEMSAALGTSVVQFIFRILS